MSENGSIDEHALSNLFSDADTSRSVSRQSSRPVSRQGLNRNRIATPVVEQRLYSVSETQTTQTASDDPDYAQQGWILNEAPEEQPPRFYEFKKHVGTAQYVPPSVSQRQTMTRFKGGGNPSFQERLLNLSRGGSAFKTEKWREKGMQRWPQNAVRSVQKQPFQFLKAAEMRPLCRSPEEGALKDIKTELFVRSLRTQGIGIQQIGNNQHSSNDAVHSLFDEEGQGWTGKTNSKTKKMSQVDKKSAYGPFTKDWVERPVAVGKMALDHMKGGRYAMDLSPRPCVPHSMGSDGREMAPPGLSTAGTGLHYLDRPVTPVPLTER